MSIKAQVAANLAGRVWSALMNFAFVPVYIHTLGVEAYGLIGFFVSIMAIFFVLDMGFSTTITRELARADLSTADAEHARNLLRTLEILYWIIGAVIALIFVVAAPAIASRWLRPDGLDPGKVVDAIRVMGLVALFRWPVSLYSGALMGLQRQVALNAVTSAYATIQGVGAATILWFISPTIQSFFLWQSVSAAAQIAIMAILTWSSFGQGRRNARWDVSTLARVARFSAGIGGITLLSIILTQLDKVLLSRIISLESFGMYSLASAIAAVIGVAGMAIYGAVFPQLSRLAADDDAPSLAAFYHSGSQLLSVGILPMAIALSFFARPLLSVYLGKPLLAAEAAPVLSLLVIGYAILAIMMMPLGLQLACGWTRLSLYKNLVAVILFVPALFVLVDRFGPLGAAILWVALTLGYLLIEVPIMHMRLLQLEKWRWYLQDVGCPMLICCVVIGGARLLTPLQTPPLIASGIAVGAGLLAMLLSAVAMPSIRAQALALHRHYIRHR